MKRIALYLGIASVLVASCSVQERDFVAPRQDDAVFFASFEQPSEETRVYANENLLLRWTADDRVSIFNKLTYNQQYQFSGETGDNAGEFRKVDTDEFVTGNAMENVVSVYPYQEGTKITEDGTLTLTLPAEQHYAENTFGLGANSMVSVSEDNFLQYKNVGGYLMLKLYGDGVTVSSITLKGNNGEKLAGKATVTMPMDGTPTVVMANDATTEITLVCDTPVALGATAEESKQFWFVVPTVLFSKGFTVTVSGNGGVFEKSTDKSLTIERNDLSKMSPIEVSLSQPKNVIYYTTSDGEIVSPNDRFGVSIVSNEYVNGQGVLTFDGDVTTIGRYAFMGETNLTGIRIPNSVTSIELFAFYGCTSLTNICIPESVTSLGDGVFACCPSMVSFSGKYASSDGFFLVDSGTLLAVAEGAINGEITIPDGITGIGDDVFYKCESLTRINLPNSVSSIGAEVFWDCINLASITIPSGLTEIKKSAFYGCKSLTRIRIPDSVTFLGIQVFMGCSSLLEANIPARITLIPRYLFSGCSSLTSIAIPDSVSEIGNYAFSHCSSLTKITMMPEIPPSGNTTMFDDTNECPIYVPYSSVDVYKAAPYWSDYADRIQAIPPSTPVPEAVDLGLSVKWASLNLGATKPEEYGDYYAWGETEPYYSSLDPLTWKAGKEAGYYWESYRLCMEGDYLSLTKYCTDPYNGYDGFTDGKTGLDLVDDPAHVLLGGNWRTPTEAEWTELINNCTWTQAEINGVNGGKVTSNKNGNSIFLPAAGYFNEKKYSDKGSYGRYWSSSLDESDSSFAKNLLLYFRFDVYQKHTYRDLGLSVRPVYAE